jgi:hypothetical protein
VVCDVIRAVVAEFMVGGKVRGQHGKEAEAMDEFMVSTARKRRARRSCKIRFKNKR